jgi:arabinogalactan oligomer / maltooligosaccharide transport system substrate-binding protein
MKFLVAALLVLAACRADDGRQTVVLWHSYGGAERAALEEVVADFNARSDTIRIEPVAVAYDGFADKITSAIPNGNGPDLFIFAHDRLGDWRAAGLLEPIEYYVDDALADHFRYQALALLSRGGSLYGLPMAEKWTALYYNTDLVAAPPRTTDELRAIAADLERRRPGTFALAYQNMELYGHAPWLHAFGGSALDADGRPDLDTPAAIAALEYTRALARDGLVPREATPGKVATLFNEGKAAMAISGPWFMTDATAVPWALAPLPVVSETGRPLQPYYGAEGVIMSARARDKDRAFEVMRALTSDPAAELRARRARQLVPNLAVWNLPAVAGDPALAVFARQVEQTVPMPGSAAMRQVWAPYERVLQSVIAQGAHPGDALAAAEREVQSYLQGAEGELEP